MSPISPNVQLKLSLLFERLQRNQKSLAFIKGRWKFEIRLPIGEMGDIARAFNMSGFDISESNRLADAIMDGNGINLAIRKDSPVNPSSLLQSLLDGGLIVKWKNPPAA